MSRTLLVLFAVGLSMLLGGCLREGSGYVANRGGIETASVQHSDPVPRSPASGVETRQTASAAPASDASLRRTVVRPHP